MCPPVYDFKAFDSSGRPQKGIVEADTLKNARLKLKKQGLMVSQISEKNTIDQAASKSVQIPFLGARVPANEIAMMTRQLASLVKSNIPLVEALNALVEQSEHAQLKVTLAAVRQDVNEGISLARALAKHPKVFDTIFINMVEAGESSGTLGLVLLRLAELKEAQMRLRSKVISGMTYPALMMVVAVGMVLVVFTVVIPKIAKVFENSRKPIPFTTQILLKVSDFMVEWWWVLLLMAFGGATLFSQYIKSEQGRPKWDAFKLKVMIFGPLIRTIAITRFAHTMATLLGSGVPILTAMNIAKNLVDSAPIARAIANARENITEGQSIADPLRRSGEFPPLMIHMIAIGEKTGELPEMLKNIAQTYEEQVNAKIDGMTALIEPVMIIGMGGVVGFIVYSIFLPIMEMSNIS